MQAIPFEKPSIGFLAWPDILSGQKAEHAEIPCPSGKGFPVLKKVIGLQCL